MVICSVFRPQVMVRQTLSPLLCPAVPGSGDAGAGGRGELRDQEGAGGGQTAVQHDQREPRKSTGHH